MPYHVAKTSKCPTSKPWGVIKDSDGKVMGCHPSKADANKQLAALYANEPSAKEAEELEERSSGEVDNSAWDASKAWANGAASDDPAAFYNGICAGKKEGDPKTQGAHALPHHYHPGDAPNAAGVRNGQSRLPQTEGLTNKSAAQTHLDNHMSTIKAAEKEDGRMKDVREARREYTQRGEVPGGRQRTKAFPGKLQARIVERNGRQFYHVDGFATVFERGYPMWDMFGEYTEVIDRDALTQTLAKNPDVAWLVNHRGVTMARTTNGTLELRVSTTKDGYTGVHSDAYLNPDRGDVHDIVSAINDELVDEMSFAFMLNEGEWNDDLTEFRITEVDIDRGDVSAVNYGANPFTSIQARTSDILEDIRRLPPVALSRARQIVTERIYHSAAQDLSKRSSERYRRAAELLERISQRDFSVTETATGEDADDSAASLAKAVDAALDTAVALFSDVDATSLPSAVQQGIDLVSGAEANIDLLLDVMGLPDPDDTDADESTERNSTSESIRREFDELEKPEEETESPVEHREGGKPVYLWKVMLDNLKEN